jgi:hypothetical protein
MGDLESWRPSSGGGLFTLATPNGPFSFAVLSGRLPRLLCGRRQERDISGGLDLWAAGLCGPPYCPVCWAQVEASNLRPGSTHHIDETRALSLSWS